MRLVTLAEADYLREIATMPCSIERPCMGLVYEDITFASEARVAGLHDTRMFRCGNGHTMMVGLPPRERGWVSSNSDAVVCQVCLKPIEGIVRSKNRGPRQHPTCHRNQHQIS